MKIRQLDISLPGVVASGTLKQQIRRDGSRSLDDTVSVQSWIPAHCVRNRNMPVAGPRSDKTTQPRVRPCTHLAAPLLVGQPHRLRVRLASVRSSIVLKSIFEDTPQRCIMGVHTKVNCRCCNAEKAAVNLNNRQCLVYVKTALLRLEH